jgi:hypothetical protein
MNIPCYYLTIVIDRINNEIVAFPKIIESIIVDTQDDQIIVQTSVTNAHRRTIKKEWVFLNKSSAEVYLQKNIRKLNKMADFAKSVYLKGRS